MMVLTLPTFAFSAASTLVPFYVPQFLYDYTSSNTLVGFIVGGEGIFCVLIPLWVGVQSDRMWTERWGRRRPFMIYAAPFMAASLILVPFQPGLVPIAVSTFIFFAAYHFYSSPYQSLLPDVTPSGFHGRVQGYQGVMRGGGMFLGMLAAPFLFGLWKPLPFIITGVLIMVFTYITVSKVEEPRLPAKQQEEHGSLWAEMARLGRATWANKPIRPLHGGSVLLGSHTRLSSAFHNQVLPGLARGEHQHERSHPGRGRSGLSGGGTCQRVPGRQVRPVFDHACGAVGVLGRVRGRDLHGQRQVGLHLPAVCSAWVGRS